MFLRTFLSLTVLAAVAAATGVAALQQSPVAFPAEICLLLTVLWMLGRLLPGRAGINIASVIVALATVGLVLVYGAVLLSKLNPLAVLVIAAALTSATFVLSVQRRQKKAEERRGMAGYCERCGYDLRKSFECCPECGADIPTDLARRRRWLGIGPDAALPPRSSTPQPRS